MGLAVKGVVEATAIPTRGSYVAVLCLDEGPWGARVLDDEGFKRLIRRVGVELVEAWGRL